MKKYIFPFIRASIYLIFVYQIYYESGLFTSIFVGLHGILAELAIYQHNEDQKEKNKPFDYVAHQQEINDLNEHS